MIGASHVYFVKTDDTSDCGQVQTCAQSDVLTKHGEIQCNVWGIFYNILSDVKQPLLGKVNTLLLTWCFVRTCYNGAKQTG